MGKEEKSGGRAMVQVEGKGAGFSRERYVWVALSVALLTIIAILLFQYIPCREQLEEEKRQGEATQAKLDALQGGSLLPGKDIGELNKQGLSKREEALAADLMQHRELIPFKGVMGGTMGFYSKNDIHVLSSRWVMAFFEDGHIGGHMLLEYAVSPRGEIQWKVISAYLD
jgi:heme exporter protein D